MSGGPELRQDLLWYCWGQEEPPTYTNVKSLWDEGASVEGVAVPRPCDLSNPSGDATPRIGGLATKSCLPAGPGRMRL